MNNQELFDKVVRHLVVQGRPSGYGYKEGGSFICAYKTVEGDRCAAGCLLPEDYDYTKTYNIVSWDNLVERQPELEKVGSIAFIMKLQRAHDTGASHFDWRRRWFNNMSDLAEAENLSTNVLEALATAVWRVDIYC